MSMETIKNPAEILDNIGRSLSHNINTPILLKHGLLEVQPALIESINKSAVSEFRMPRSTMEPQENHPIPTFNLQNQHENQNNHQSLRCWQILQTNLNIEQGEKHKASDFSKKILNVGNLSPVVTEENFYELFGFKITSYL